MQYRFIRSALALVVVLAATGCSSEQDYSSLSATEARTELVDAADAATAAAAADATAAEADVTAVASDSAVAIPGHGGDDTYDQDVYDHTSATDSLSSNCVGSSSLRTCTDASGNSYTTQRIGDVSFTDGYNSRTGSSWNQSTQRIGDMSFTTGTDADGNTWNSTTQTIGDTTFQYGTNSEGESFSSTCNEYGCY